MAFDALKPAGKLPSAVKDLLRYENEKIDNSAGKSPEAFGYDRNAGTENISDKPPDYK